MSPIVHRCSNVVFSLVLCIPLAAVAEDTSTTQGATASNQASERSNEDHEICSALQRDLEDAERIRAGQLNVQCRNGLVTLSGTVESLLDKRLASRIAKRTRGVQAVLNQILVQTSERSDDAIRDDVSQALLVNNSVEKPSIALHVQSGKVAMTGKVDSLAEKRIAETVVSGVPGVTEVKNQLTVRLSSDRTDREMRDEIAALMVHSVYLDDVDVDVQVKDHVAILNGTVHSAEQKDHLERVAEIWGIASVEMESVKINPDATDGTKRSERYAKVSDQGISDALKRSFRADPVVFKQSDQISVDVQSGTVILSGTVATLPIKRAAEQLAYDVVGVRRVSNELTVQWPDHAPDDAEIISTLQQSLARSPYLKRTQLRVHCHAAHVSLYGLVDTEQQKSMAQWLAENIPGVVHVNNALTVEQPWEEKADDEIKNDLERKLKFVFFDKSNDVNVSIENGVAILRGQVDTWRQWQAAMDLAIEAGARHPHNLIQVRYHDPHGASRIYVPE
ncbi:MAG: BON domain-containing protein [Pirellulaceae bacterium]|nr:BON domain-containing protein [Pirellulaceae bacterium]